MTEIANLLTQAGIGQSTCVSVGGDPIVGTTFLDLLPLYEADPQTRALVLFCEPGGIMEERLADHLRAHPGRLPIIAFVAGRFADRIQGVRFGHAGAMVEVWRKDQLMPATIQTYLSFLRGLGKWMGKNGFIRGPQFYGLESQEYQRHEAAQRDKTTALPVLKAAAEKGATPEAQAYARAALRQIAATKVPAKD